MSNADDGNRNDDDDIDDFSASINGC